MTSALTKQDLSTSDTELFLKDPAAFEKKKAIEAKYHPQTGKTAGEKSVEAQAKMERDWENRDTKNRSQAFRYASSMASGDKTMTFTTNSEGITSVTGGSAQARATFQREADKKYAELTLNSVRRGTLDPSYIASLKEGDLYRDVTNQGKNSNTGAEYLVKSYGYNPQQAQEIIDRGVQSGMIPASFNIRAVR